MSEGSVPEGGPGTEDLDDTVGRGQGVRAEGLLKGKDMIFAEGEESKALYNLLIKKKKAVKTRFTVNSETVKVSLAKDKDTLGSHYYTNMLCAKIHLAIEEAIS